MKRINTIESDFENFELAKKLNEIINALNNFQKKIPSVKMTKCENLESFELIHQLQTENASLIRNLDALQQKHLKTISYNNTQTKQIKRLNKYSHYAIHNTFPKKDEPCWQCNNKIQIENLKLIEQLKKTVANLSEAEKNESNWTRQVRQLQIEKKQLKEYFIKFENELLKTLKELDNARTKCLKKNNQLIEVIQSLKQSELKCTELQKFSIRVEQQRASAVDELEKYDKLWRDLRLDKRSKISQKVTFPTEKNKSETLHQPT